MSLPYSSFFKKMRDSPFKLRLAVILGLAGIVLIMLSELISPDEDKPSGKADPEQPSASDTLFGEEYKKRIEKDLADILSQVNGVGECSIMVTLESTEEYIYAGNVQLSAERTENQLVFTEQDGDKSPIIERVITPRISGVLVVCQGGGDVRVSERVIKAVSQALGLSANRICVEEKIN